MNFFNSLTSAVVNAGQAALSSSNSVPSLPQYSVTDAISSYVSPIWTLHDGVKKDDQSLVSIFSFESTSTSQNRALLPLARNALRKLRALRHPNILKFLDGTETDTSIWIVTEHVHSLAVALQENQVAEESKLFGLLHISTALAFLNKDGASVHGNLRPQSVWITQGSEWKLGGMEMCTRVDDDAGVLWSTSGALMPDANAFASPEVKKSGWAILKENDPSALDAYHLYLFLYTVFNGPLPPNFSSTPLPQTRGSIPATLFPSYRRLANPLPRARLKTPIFLELGLAPETSTSGGWWPSNRLVKLSSALESFSLASESEKSSLVRLLREAAGNLNQPLPDEFLKYKVLPSLVRAFEFGGAGPQLLPLILMLAKELPEKEYNGTVMQPLIRMFATPDRAMRMVLLEGLDKFADKLTSKDVVEKIWPHLLTGFGDLVPVIREATVKSILLIAPKLSDRILNNDLLRHLAKTQTDAEPGIRTNTCILLGRLAKFLQLSTARKVLVPAFARALRDPFVHARIAGLMALMATVECYEKEDLAGKVIPAMSICLVDREKAVRDQGYKAIDMFIKKCEALSANMPDTAVIETGPPSAAVQAVSLNQPGLALNAAGAAGALAGWAFASVSKKLSAAELQAPIDRANPISSPSSPQPPNVPVLNGNGFNGARPNHVHHLEAPNLQRSASESSSIPGGFELSEEDEREDWGGDLMDVNDDEGDWDEFASGQASPPRVDPFAARLAATKTKGTPVRKGGALKLGGVTKSSALRVPMDMDAADSWDIDSTPSFATPPANLRPAAPKPKPIPTPVVAISRSSPAPTPLSPPRPTPIVRSPRPSAPPAPPTPLPAPVARPPPPRASTPVETQPPPPKTYTQQIRIVTPPPIPRSPSPVRVATPEEKAPLSKEERLAAAREERRARMARAKNGT